METVTLKPLLHRCAEHIALQFENNTAINNLVRSIAGIKWSRTHGCWHLPVSKENIAAIKSELNGHVHFDATALNEYLAKRRQVAASQVQNNVQIVVPKSIRPLATTTAWKLSANNLKALNRFMEELKLKAYSASTQRTYRTEFLQLLNLLKEKPVDSLTGDDLRRYFIYCSEQRKLTENTLHSRINAIKFYYEQVLKREKFFWTIPRPKKKLMLPKVLNETELRRLFQALDN